MSSLHIRIAVTLVLVIFSVSGTFADDTHETIPLTDVRAGVVKVDITPPLECELEGYADRTGPATGIHSRLEAVVTVFDDGSSRAAVIALDTLTLDRETGDMIKRRVHEKAGIPPGLCIVNVSHTHASPRLRNNPGYRERVIRDIAGAAADAVRTGRPVSVGYGEGLIDFNINRRVIDGDGKCRSGLNPAGVCDHRVKVLRLDTGDTDPPMAVIMLAACHANVFRGANTRISSDFPGAARAFVEKSLGTGTTAAFLQGCSGNIRANLPSVPGGWKSSIDDFGRSGSDIDMTWAGLSLGCETVRVAARLRVRDYIRDRPALSPIAGIQRTVRVDADPTKLRNGFWERAWDRVEDGKVLVDIKVLRIGDIWFVAFPGEPVIEYALAIEEMMEGMGHVLVMGYTTGESGYIPVATMFPEGGYEVQGPYSPSSERQILDAVMGMVDELR